MASALTIVVLLALSVTLVRIASVAMRLTGLPDNVARFQCISALTGTGFTTRESEMIVNYPIRRRVLVLLMILGNLGLISVAATFVVAFVDASGDTGAVLEQILALALAIGVTMFVMTNKTLDTAMCGAIGAVLERTTSLGRHGFQRILQLDDGYSVAEHVVVGTTPRSLREFALDRIPITPLAVRSGDTRDFRQIEDGLWLAPGDTLICYGDDAAHRLFDERMAG